jgi:hypothetical protein
MWRLQNDEAPASRDSTVKEEESSEAAFTEIELDVRPPDTRAAPLSPPWVRP